MDEPYDSSVQLNIPLNPTAQEHYSPAQEPAPPAQEAVNTDNQQLHLQTISLEPWPTQNPPVVTDGEPNTLPGREDNVLGPVQMRRGNNMAYVRRSGHTRYSVGDCLFDLFIRLPWLTYTTIVHFLTFPVIGILDIPLLQLRPQLQQTVIELVLRMLQMWIALAVCNVYMAFESIYESDQIDDISEYLSSTTLHLTILVYIIGILLHTCNWPLVDFWYGLQSYICAFFMRLCVEDFSFATRLPPIAFLPIVVIACWVLIQLSILVTKSCQWGHTYFQKRKFEMECDVFGLTGGHCMAQICIMLICKQYIPLRARGVNQVIRDLTGQYNQAVRSNYYLFVALGVFFTLSMLHWIDRCIPALNTNIFYMPRTADSFSAGSAKFIDIMVGFFLGSLFVPPHSGFRTAELFAFANGVTFVLVIVFFVFGLYESTIASSSQTKCNHIRRIYTRTGGFMLAAVWDQSLQNLIEMQSNSKFLTLVYKLIYASLLTFAWVVIGLAVTQLKSRVLKDYVKRQQYTRALYNLG